MSYKHVKANREVKNNILKQIFYFGNAKLNIIVLILNLEIRFS